MKRSLKEELDRIFILTYGKKPLSEQQSYTDRLLNFVGLDGKPSTNGQKYDDPRKANFVSSDVNDLYKTLETTAQSGGLKQESYGSMTYKKEVESLQIGLVLLGYTLPQHGVDGLFGPETAAAVQKFDTDNKVVNESAQDLRMTLSSLGDTEKGSEISSGGELSDQITKIVNSILQDFKKSNPNVKVTVTAGNDVYHQKLGYPSKHKTGQAVDIVLNPLNGDTKNAFQNLCNQYKQKDPNFMFINEYDHPSGAATAGHFHLEYGTGNVAPKVNNKNLQQGQTSNITATPTMITKLIEMLKQRGVKPEDLTNLMDPVNSGGGEMFTDLNLNDDQGYQKYMKICQKFINMRNPSAIVSGEMMASAARNAFQQNHKYVPPELALAQLTAEGGLSSNPHDRPIRTRNPFDVGNTETGSKSFGSVQDAVNAYYQLITKNYIGNGKTASDLSKNFVDKNNQRYATSTTYELDLNKIAREANQVAKSIV